MKNLLLFSVKTILVLLFSSSCINAQKPTKYKLNTESIRGIEPFSYTRLPLVTLGSDAPSFYSMGLDSSSFDYYKIYQINTQIGYSQWKGLKRENISYDSIVKRVQKNNIPEWSIPPHEIKQGILVFSGINIKNNTKTVIADQNNNNLLSDDTAFVFSLNELKTTDWFEKSVMAISFPIHVYNGKAVLLKRHTLRLLPYSTSHKFIDTLNNILQVYATNTNYLQAVLNVNSSKLFFAIGGGSPQFATYNNKGLDIIISNSDKFPKKSMGNPAYRFGDTLIIQNELISLDSISGLGDTLYVTHLGKTNRNTGFVQGRYAFNFRSTDSERNVFDLLQYRGKMILVDFWGTWCIPCKEVLPDLKALYKKYPSNKFTMVSIAVERNLDTKKWNEVILKDEMSWIQLWEAKSFDIKDQSPISDRFKISSFPGFLLIDPKGKIIMRGDGVDYMKSIKNHLKKYFGY